MQTDIVIMIGTRNRKKILTKCLNALLGNITTNHRIIVIDAGSTDGTNAYLEQEKRIQHILDGKAIGQAQSFNRVLRNLQCKFVCWLSDDNVVQPGALDEAVDILRKNGKIGMVALKTKDVKGPYVGAPYIGGIYQTGILNCNQGVIRYDLFEKLGFFDEAFKNYGIDSVLTTNVLLAGYSIAYTKCIAINHHRDHDSDLGAISHSERAHNRQSLRERYNHKFNYLIECSLFQKANMGIKRFLWRIIIALKKSKKKNMHALKKKKFAGFLIKDWYNLTHCRYISNLDFFYNRNKPYYLEQRIPKAKLNPKVFRAT